MPEPEPLDYATPEKPNRAYLLEALIVWGIILLAVIAALVPMCIR